MQKVLMIISAVFGVAIVVGAVTFGGYLYFGDEPRLQRGTAYYKGREYQKAYKMLLPLAKKGLAKAQLIVGDCHANGQGVFIGKEEAVKWYRQAADQELPEAQYRMFKCCRDGVGMERNQENAAKWCRKAAEAGSEEAMFDMAMLYVNGTGVPKDEKNAFKWFRKGAERGHPPSLYKFGLCYKLGYGVEKDEDEASKWQNKAVTAWRENANAGNTAAMVRLAELYKEGDVVELDKEEAVKWYRKAAEAGDANAQFNLATCLHKGEGVEQDDEESAKWMLKSAEQGTDRGCQWVMGRYYEDGTGVEKSMTEAVKWFERSAKKGFSLAKLSLAMCYLKGDGVQKDEATAERLLEEAADAGNKDAANELKRIRDERAAMERRIANEMAAKLSKIKKIEECETIVSGLKNTINEIISGKNKDEEWKDFDADKIAKTDNKVDVKREPPLKKLSSGFSETSESDKIDAALESLEKESDRLSARINEFRRVKETYDAKELESRKETCKPCDGTGTVECARCNGSGEIAGKNMVSCPTCEGKRQFKRQVSCSNCHGKGSIAAKCNHCWRQNGLRNKNCTWCGGSGLGDSETCRKCDGYRKVYMYQACMTCQGHGEVMNDSKVTCPACKGKGKLKCERCNGRGFTYRPKEGE